MKINRHLDDIDQTAPTDTSVTDPVTPDIADTTVAGTEEEAKGLDEGTDVDPPDTDQENT